jgi:uncharacterized protein YfiM (DUF2279 family)
MAARGASDTFVGARQGRHRSFARESSEERRSEEAPEAESKEVGGEKAGGEEAGARAQAETMSQVAALCLAVNVIYAQTAVTRDSWFGIDKIKHFFISAFIESVSYSALQAARVNHRTALTGAIGVSAALGVARELHDKRTPGNRFSYKDLTWDALGITAGAVTLKRTIK